MSKQHGEILFEKSSHEKLRPASVTKVMSILLIMEALDRGDITLETQIPCSEKASSMGGSQIWLDSTESLSVHEMLKAICVVSANDCTVAMAEYLAGSEELFVQKMNDRATADYMGMLATAMNGLALQDALESRGIYTRLQTAIEMREIAEPYIKRKAAKHLERGRVVIFACGTGNPYFSTDTGAALRAAEINAEVILLAKTIDGVYSADPKLDPTAVKYDEISYTDILTKDLKVMDSTATALCRDNQIPLMVFGIDKPENMVKIVKGENIGTIVK